MLNVPKFRSTLLINYKYVMNSSNFMIDLPLVSFSLHNLLKNNIHFIKRLEYTQMLFNCS